MHSKIISACIATSCVLAARGCTTQIKNTVVNRNVNLPIAVTGVVVIYETSRFGNGRQSQLISRQALQSAETNYVHIS